MYVPPHARGSQLDGLDPGPYSCAHLLKLVLNLSDPMRPYSVVVPALAFMTLAGTPARGDAQAAPETGTPGDVGVLVMAHGGTPDWDRAIAASIEARSARVPTVVAFGMADRSTLSAAFDSLSALGVEHVAIVRLFISGASFLEQTRYFVGLSDVPPSFFIPSHGGHGGGDHAAPNTPIEHALTVATHDDGLMGSPEAAEILEGRALALSTDKANESVLLIAHGMGDEAENQAVIDAMRQVASSIGEDGFARVEVATLREDWPAARVEEEARIRAFVEAENAAGRRVIVLPYRLNGFGPYATVLEGLSYVAAEALLPHDAVARWIERKAAEISAREGWARPVS